MENKTFFDKNKWFFLVIGIILLLLWKNFHAEFGFNELSSSKKDSMIVKSMDANTSKIISAIDQNEKNTLTAVKAVGDSVSASGKRIGDSISSLKKACIKCKEEIKEPKKQIAPKKPKTGQCNPCDSVKIIKTEEKPKKCPCPYDAKDEYGNHYIYYYGDIPSDIKTQKEMGLRHYGNTWYIKGERKN